jgi:hypothetical protein
MDDRLFEELMFQLNNHTDMTQWEATDRLNGNDWDNINATIRHVFAPYIRQYAYTAVVSTLQTCRNTLCHVVWASMNVPFPRDPFEHIDRVVENAVNVFHQMTSQRQMLLMNHYAHLIQRNWRRAIADPSYIVCRNRLMFEFKQMSRE